MVAAQIKKMIMNFAAKFMSFVKFWYFATYFTEFSHNGSRDRRTGRDSLESKVLFLSKVLFKEEASNCLLKNLKGAEINSCVEFCKSKNGTSFCLKLSISVKTLAGMAMFFKPLIEIWILSLYSSPDAGTEPVKNVLIELNVETNLLITKESPSSPSWMSSAISVIVSFRATITFWVESKANLVVPWIVALSKHVKVPRKIST